MCVKPHTYLYMHHFILNSKTAFIMTKLNSWWWLGDSYKALEGGDLHLINNYIYTQSFWLIICKHGQRKKCQSKRQQKKLNGTRMASVYTSPQVHKHNIEIDSLLVHSAHVYSFTNRYHRRDFNIFWERRGQTEYSSNTTWDKRLL